MGHILHTYRRCPFCIRVRILLHLKQIPYETIEEPLRVWTPWMHKWSTQNGERPRVPILRLEDASGKETIFTESNNILRMIDAQCVPTQYTPLSDSETYQEMFSWFSWCDTILKPHIDMFKYGKNLVLNTTEHIQNTKTLRDILRPC